MLNFRHDDDSFLKLILTLSLILLPITYLYYRRSNSTAPTRPVVNQNANAASLASQGRTAEQQQTKSIMQPTRTDLDPPKDDPFTLEQLKEFDGSNPDKPIYVSIKGTIFDVTHKRDVYGAGKSYNIFAGKDGSRGLGMSSLKLEDAVPDWSVLDEKDLKTLNDWHDFFKKRYNIVGKVSDLPEQVADKIPPN
ncbi:progesterone binding protein [Moniliophthora roreri MCA 2997]|uniref:Progesterone binding protein n=2 Tax=Moniliophthora roreri TaxID=221103 RepID=V2WIB4_MONRO|nr:progesterone binding protein [Moniliophthora roreri MCA 2997]KAI3599184.1 progesterone binding protein [Moniliophthora roreri]